MAKRIERVLSGEAVWPPPLWLMRQAGRYLPEYRAVRATAGDFVTLATTPSMAAEVTLQPVRRYGMDAAILFSDILMVPWALGQELAFKAGEGPVLPPIRDASGMAGLDIRRVPGAITPILEAVRLVKAGVGDATLIGFAGSPFTVACYMVEGGGSKDFAHVRGLAYADPALFGALIDLLVETTIIYLKAQIEAGAEVVMLFDTWAGMLPPRQFRLHVIEATRRIVSAVKTAHPGIRIIGFPRMAGLLLGEYAAATGVDGVGVDTAADIGAARGLVPGHVAVQGNLDPLLLVAGGAAMEAEARAIRETLRGTPHIFNLGHGIVPQTPPEHVGALVAAIRG